MTAVLPGECRVCGRALVRAGLAPVCDDCVAAVMPQQKALCRRCGESLPVERERFGETECGPCRMVAPEFERAVAFAEYDDAARALVWLLKYERVKPVARILGKMLGEAVLELRGGAAGAELVVVAVPLFRAKERSRGFNQSEEMVRAALEVVRRREPEWGLRFRPGVMERTRQTKGQFTLDVRARRRNLTGAFRVRDAAAVSGREVLLVDDIYTTGATARECARVLRRAGAVKVWVATVARAQRPEVEFWSEGAMRAPLTFGTGLGRGIFPNLWGRIERMRHEEVSE